MKRLPHTTVLLGLGSNLGDRAANLRMAVRRLGETPGSVVVLLSRLYESAPVGPRDQPWFLNAVAEIAVTLPPEDLLATAKRIEREMGRRPSERWGPRTIDIDILLYGDAQIASPTLTVPHPELWNRRFVLLPLADLITSGPLAERMRQRADELEPEQVVRLHSDWDTHTAVERVVRGENRPL